MNRNTVTVECLYGMCSACECENACACKCHWLDAHAAEDDANYGYWPDDEPEAGEGR